MARSGCGADWVGFERDPYLPGLQQCLRRYGRVDGRPAYEVLRYVPLRRFTFRTADVVAKVKRRSRLLHSYAAATALGENAAGSSVRVPALRGVDPHRSVYFQQAVSGTPLPELVRDDTVADLFAEAGRVHAALHELPSGGLPEADPEEAVREVAHAADWLAVLQPDLAGWLAEGHDALLAARPRPAEGTLGTCHGDLLPSHLLATDTGWTVIDLDLAHRGDRYRDLAWFLARVPTDVAPLADEAGSGPLEAAEQAYLASYEERAGRRIDRRRLTWHRAAAELHHLAVSFSKDRVRADTLPRVLALLDRLLGDLAGGGAR